MMLEHENKYRRNLESVDFIDIMAKTCDAVINEIGCPLATLSLQALCGVTASGLRAIDFPSSIRVPSISDLELFNIPTPDMCATMSLQASLDYETAFREGIPCGGHFSGSTIGAANIGGNPAGDAVYTFIAGDSTMVIDACESNYDSYIRVYEKRIRYRRFWGINLPYVQFRQIASNDDSYTCGRSTGNWWGSHLTLHNLRVGHPYTLVIEGYRSRAGEYRVDITCPNRLG